MNSIVQNLRKEVFFLISGPSGTRTHGLRRDRAASTPTGLWDRFNCVCFLFMKTFFRKFYKVLLIRCETLIHCCQKDFAVWTFMVFPFCVEITRFFSLHLINGRIIRICLLFESLILLLQHYKYNKKISEMIFFWIFFSCREDRIRTCTRGTPFMQKICCMVLYQETICKPPFYH